MPSLHQLELVQYDYNTFAIAIHTIIIIKTKPLQQKPSEVKETDDTFQRVYGHRVVRNCEMQRGRDTAQVLIVRSFNSSSGNLLVEGNVEDSCLRVTFSFSLKKQAWTACARDGGQANGNFSACA